MKGLRKLLYLLSFVGLAVTATLEIDRIGRPSIAAVLVLAVVVATLAGAPGLVHRRAWPAALVLLPLGAYLILRAQLPAPPHLRGLGQQLSFYLSQLRAGVNTYARDGFPLDFSATVDVKLLLSMVVYATTGLAAFVALSLRKALPGIVIVLVLLGFGFTTDEVDRILWAPLAFLFLAGCMLMLSRSLRRERWKTTDAVAGVGTAMIASLLALSLLGATPVAAGKPWQDWRTWDLIGTDSVHLAFNWMENYPRLLDAETNAEVMRVESPVASYWRANALDYFNGTTWSSGASYDIQLQGAWTSGSYTYSVPLQDPEPPGKLVTETFAIQSTFTDHVFTGGTPKVFVFGGPVPLRMNNARALGADPPLGPKLDYKVTAVIPQLKPADLVDRGRAYSENILAYAAMPFPTLSDVRGSEAAWRSAMSSSASDREWLGLYQLNRDIVGQATDPYEIALRVEEYLRSAYTYSLTPPRSDYRSPYAAFLFDTRAGYCQHFAGAMAALLRFNGIPARVAVGFATGKRVSGDTFVVDRNDAHAWVEVYFPQLGWVSFDPTPARILPGPGPSSTNAGFVDPYVAGRRAGANDLSSAAVTDPRGRPDRGADQKGASAGTSAAPLRALAWLPWSVALVAALVAWPVGRGALRRRALRRGGMDERLRASLALVYAELRDYGVAVPRSQTLEETSRFLEQHLGLDAAALADRVQAVLFGGRAATVANLEELAAFRRELKRRLRARRGRMCTLRALYGLRGASPGIGKARPSTSL